MTDSMKALVIDIETAPNLAHVWRLWKTSVALNQLIVPGYTLCFAAKWLGEKDVFFARVEHDAKTGAPTEKSRRAMLNLAHRLLSEADVVIHYNGVAFDIPKLNAEFIELGYAPPAPFVQVDLLLTLRKRANFPSNKLAFISERLGVGSKVKHEGHELWRKCMADDADAWARMQRYNEGDVRLTERLYRRILPWIPSHPNRGLYTDDDKPRCPHCQSAKVWRKGYAYTRLLAYPRYECQKCGAWSRGKKSVRTSVDRRPTE